MPRKKHPLLASILLEPANLDTRRVYADSLMELGDPRGEFIALQIELAESTGHEEDYPTNLAASQRLEFEHGETWLKAITKATALKPADFGRVEVDARSNAHFENGFVSRVAMQPSRLDKTWKKISALEPIEGAEVIVNEYLEEESFELEAPSTFRSLKISPEGWVTAYSIAQVLHWGLDAAEEVDLSGCDLGVPGTKLLTGAESQLGDFHDDFKTPPPLNPDRIERLLLKNTGLSDEGTSLLSEWDAAEQLQVLDISQCRIAEAATVKALKKFSGLRELHVGGNMASFAALKGWKTLKQLEAMSVPQTIEAKEFKSLFPKPSDQLRKLDLAAAKELASSPELVAKAARQYVELNLGSTSLGDEKLAELLQYESIESTVHLILNKCSLSDKGLKSILDSELSRLVSLDISSNKLSDRALQELASWPGIEQLTFLRVRNNRKLSHEGLQCLVDCPEFQPVRFDVGKCKDKGFEKALAERFGSAAVLV